MKNLLWVGAFLVTTSCASLTNLQDSELTSGYYQYREAGARPKKVYLNAEQDSVAILDADTKTPIPNRAGQVFRKGSFDVDVLVVTFKVRPSAGNLPQQLTTDFNGNIFLGYRSDWFKSKYVNTPAGVVKKLRNRSLTWGAFTGIGTSSVTPSTTRYQINDEYNGLIVSHGISAMAGVNKITVGLGVGWDYLTDRDKHVWIYQNKPWVGLTLSLNLN